MSLNEKRLLLLGISKINPVEFPKTDQVFQFTVTQKEWSTYFPEESSYRELKKSAGKLRSRFITLHPKTGITDEINWFYSIRYIPKEGSVRMTFTRSMQVRLAGMIEEFTKINLLSVNTLKSIYSIRLYEMLSQFRKTGYRVISLEDFRFCMDCSKKYPATKKLKQVVLNPSIKELNENSDLQIMVEDIKTGKVITGLRFFFKQTA